MESWNSTRNEAQWGNATNLFFHFYFVSNPALLSILEVVSDNSFGSTCELLPRASPREEGTKAVELRQGT
jgi:hypothetical protein